KWGVGGQGQPQGNRRCNALALEIIEFSKVAERVSKILPAAFRSRGQGTNTTSTGEGLVPLACSTVSVGVVDTLRAIQLASPTMNPAASAGTPFATTRAMISLSGKACAVTV